MATSNYIDLTEEFNDNGTVVLDVSLYTSGAIYFYGLSATTQFYCTNNGGEEDGKVNGSPLTATDFGAIKLLNLANNTYSINTGASANAFFQFKNIGKYLKIGKGGVTLEKLIIQLKKII